MVKVLDLRSTARGRRTSSYATHGKLFKHTCLCHPAVQLVPAMMIGGWGGIRGPGGK